MDGTEVHHRVPQYLLRAYDRMAAHTAFDGEGIGLALEFEWLALRHGIRETDHLTREGLRERIEASRVTLPSGEHRRLHAEDWRRWGSLGGNTTLARYGRGWFALLSLKRWGRIPGEELAEARERLRKPRPNSEPGAAA